MPTKVNIVLDDDVKADLDRLVETGMRSRVINTALRREILALQRQQANQRLDELRKTTRPVSMPDVVKLIRRDPPPMTAGPAFVPDASVLLKWVLRSNDEAGRDRALELKTAWLAGACQIVVPNLWVYEVGNVLGTKQPATAGALLEAMVDLRIPEEPPAADLEQIFSLMAKYHVTFYDAACHALAIRRGGTMLTADRRYVTKAARAGHLRLLDDWHPE